MGRVAELGSLVATRHVLRVMNVSEFISQMQERRSAASEKDLAEFAVRVLPHATAYLSYYLS